MDDDNIRLDENINPLTAMSKLKDSSSLDNQNVISSISSVLPAQETLIYKSASKRKNESSSCHEDCLPREPNGIEQNDSSIKTLVRKTYTTEHVASDNFTEVRPSQISDAWIDNQSEAGPDVAELTAHEFRSAAEFLKDPSAFEFLQKAGNSKALQDSTLARLSLFVKFDPLLNKFGSKPHTGKEFESLKSFGISKQDCNIEVAGGGDIERIDMAGGSIVEETGNKELIDFTSSPMKKMDSSAASNQATFCARTNHTHRIFTEEELNQALKLQELLFQEKLIKKDKEHKEKIQEFDNDQVHSKKQVHSLHRALMTTRIMTEELIKVFTTFKESKDQERVDITTDSQKLTKERDQALEDMRNVETAFSDLHRRYEKMKTVLEGYKQNEDMIKQQSLEAMTKLKQQEQMYEMLRSRTQEKLDSANLEIENARKSVEAEVAALRAQLKKSEMKISSLDKSLDQKTKENIELSNLVDDLVAKVGKSKGLN